MQTRPRSAAFGVHLQFHTPTTGIMLSNVGEITFIFRVKINKFNRFGICRITPDLEVPFQRAFTSTEGGEGVGKVEGEGRGRERLRGRTVATSSMSMR